MRNQARGLAQKISSIMDFSCFPFFLVSLLKKMLKNIKNYEKNFYVKFDWEISKITNKIIEIPGMVKENSFFRSHDSFLFFGASTTKLLINLFVIQKTCILSSKY